MSFNKIKILMVLGNTKRGGAQAFILNVLHALDKNKFQVDLAVNYEVDGGISDEVHSLGCNIYIFPSFKIYNWLKFSKFWDNFFSKKHYDVVHAHSTNSAFLYLKIAQKHGCHTIAHSHSAGYRGGFIETLAKKFFAPKVKGVADYWFACSDKAAERLYGNDFKDSEKYFSIPNAIPVQKFLFNSEWRNQIRTNNHISSDTLVCGHAGTFSKPKNHQFIIDIFTEVIKKNPSSKLLLCGVGDLMPSIKEYAKTKGVLNKIIFAGSVSNVNQYMMAMDALIFPSLFEGLPVTIVEAQASGLPVFMSDNITKEVNLTDLIYAKSLTLSAEKWADAIVSHNKMMNIESRSNYNNLIAQTHFNMDKTICLISQLYTNLSVKKNTL